MEREKICQELYLSIQMWHLSSKKLCPPSKLLHKQTKIVRLCVSFISIPILRQTDRGWKKSGMGVSICDEDRSGSRSSLRRLRWSRSCTHLKVRGCHGLSPSRTARSAERFPPRDGSPTTQAWNLMTTMHASERFGALVVPRYIYALADKS